MAALMVAAFSLVIGYPTFKLQSLYYSLATFALLQVMLTIFRNFKTIFGIRGA